MVGRPQNRESALNERLQIPVAPEMLDAIESKAREQMITRAEWVRRVLEEKLKEAADG